MLNDETRERANNIYLGTTKVEKIDALYFTKFMQTIDENISKLASLRLNNALRVHLQKEKMRLRIDEKITKKVLQNYLKKKGITFRSNAVKAEMLVKMQKFVDDETRQLINEEIDKHGIKDLVTWLDK